MKYQWFQILLLLIHQQLCEIFGCNLNEPFAKETVLVVGDLLQLPPVKAQYVFIPPPGPFANLFSLWSLFKMCELTEVMRQRGDAEFINLLNNVRIGKPTEADFQLLESRYANIELIDQNTTLLFAENSIKHDYNHQQLKKLSCLPSVEIEAIDEYPENISSGLKNNFQQLSQDKTAGLAQNLFLKKQARIMLTANIDISDTLINGQLGTIFDFEHNEGNITKIYLKLDDTKAGLKAKNCDKFTTRNNVIPIERSAADIPISKYSNIYVKRSQFPLMLAWACTIHKVQGLTLQTVGISLELLKQRNFSAGQLYVALSRSTALSTLSLLGKLLFNKHVNVNQACLDEYSNLRSNSNCLTSVSQTTNAFLSLLNIRGLITNIRNFINDRNVYETTPFICLTETHLTHNSNIDDVKSNFQEYQLTCSNSDNKYESLAILYKPQNFVCEETLSLNGILYAKFRPLCASFSVNILLVYRRNNLKIEHFLNTICYFAAEKSLNIILGDLNINDFHDNIARTTLLALGFQQFVTKPTHIRGGIIDHIYLRNSHELSHLLSSFVSCNYYSDHQNVFLQYNQNN